MADPLFLYKLKNGLLGTPDNYGGLLGPEQTQQAQDNGMMNFGASLLAASGPSATPISFGQAFGQAALQGRQAAQQSGQNALQSLLLKKQLQQATKKESPFGSVNPSDFTPESLKAFQVSGNYGDLIPKKDKGIGNFNPDSYTPESFDIFLKTGDVSSLKRYVAPAQPSVQIVNGVPTIVQPERGGGPAKLNPLSSLDTESRAKSELERAKTQGGAAGEAAGAQASKAPAAASMDYVMKEFEKELDNTMQGGPLGVKGKAGAVLDYENATRFDNLQQQLSTELRTVYRIPGEGTLSDREQAQYGVQLPSRNNSKRVNKAILDDLRERTRLRLETPTDGSAPKTGVAPKVRRYNPATGKIE